MYMCQLLTQAHSSMQDWYLPLPGSLLGLACSACLLYTAQARMVQPELPGCKVCSGLQASMTSIALFGTSQILYMAAATAVAKAAGRECWMPNQQRVLNGGLFMR